jgi:hypothetical protein
MTIPASKEETSLREAKAKLKRDAYDEAEEKLAYLAAGRLRMTREQLIQKITQVGSSRWSLGSWMAAREKAAFERGRVEQLRQSLEDTEATIAVFDSEEVEIIVKADGGHLITFALNKPVDLEGIVSIKILHPGKSNGRWYQNYRILEHEFEK